MRFEYPARFEDCAEEIVVSFPDIPEALTSGDSFEEAYAAATDALGAALAGYAVHGVSMPAPSPIGAGLVSVSPPPLVAAKLALGSRLKDLKLTNVALAERLGVSETVVRRLLDPDHASKLAHVARALEALGQHLIIEVAEHRPDAA